MTRVTAAPARVTVDDLGLLAGAGRAAEHRAGVAKSTSSAVSTRDPRAELGRLPRVSRRSGSASVTVPANASPVSRYSAITSGSS